ncbi:hypothetical protein KY290_013607 [Solanum tuberosum]|uniref:DUF7745 domain-containing protein n=1 Tax=Solanum tuberosum TaxID=4113 RepID=A0ABQ7VM70_SOLTU|nr:hypothetical protein KY290_013607 [Solanum tuberosum]
MGSYEQRRVEEHLGHLVHLMEIDPRRDVIETLIPFWDPNNNVFRFSNFEVTPTLEEIASFMGKRFSIRSADLCNKRPIVPKNVDAKKFLDLLKINQIEKESLKNGWVSLEFLYERGLEGEYMFCLLGRVFGAHCFPQTGQAYRHSFGWAGEGVDHNGKSYYYSYDPDRYALCID